MIYYYYIEIYNSTSRNFIYYKKPCRGVSKGELRVLQLPLLIFWWWKSGKYWVKSGKICKKRGKRILRTPLSNIFDTPLPCVGRSISKSFLFILSESCFFQSLVKVLYYRGGFTTIAQYSRFIFKEDSYILLSICSSSETVRLICKSASVILQIKVFI